MIQIIPAILATSEQQYKNDLAKLESADELHDGWIHIDFADNKFVQNKTIEPEIVKKFPTNFHKEAHLMVAHPSKWIDKLIEAGFERIIFHAESEDDAKDVTETVKSRNLEVGVAINPQTPVASIESLLNKLDVVLVMTVMPGFQGGTFVPKSLNKIHQIQTIYPEVKVGVDGGIKDSNIKEVANAGVDYVTMGSYLLKGDIEENLEILWEEVDGH
jgi:ribulose-phosphate 3-epimerase